MNPEPPDPLAGRPTSHRASQAAVGARRVLMPLAAVATVAIVIAVLLFLNGHAHTGPDASTVIPPVTHGPSQTPSPGPTAVVLPPPPSTSATKPSRTATPAPAHSPAPSVRPTASSPATTEAAPKLQVDVYNNSRRQGLAHQVADELRSGGWPVGDVGNLQGRIAETTIYYAPGQEPSARRLAAQFSSIQRVLPRFDGLPGSGLTLVVTRSWSN